jgi:uncharacterized protein (TIRG00374 family)
MDPTQVRPRRRGVPRWVFLVLTYAVSVVSLVWALRGYDFSQVMPAIRSVKWAWVMVAIVLDLSVYVLHGWRWNTLLSPVKRLPLWRTVQAIFVGLFANEVLPLRPGEIIRCYLLAHWSELPFSLTLTSMAIERVMDGIWLVVAFWISASLMNMPRPLVDFVELMAVGLVILALLFLWVLFHKKHAHSVMSSQKWAQKFIHVLDEIHHMGNSRTLAASFGITSLYWLVQVLSIWALFKSYEMDLSVWPASVFLVITRLGTAIPSAPGNVGVFNSVAKMALTLFGVEPGVAFELSFLIFVALTLPLLIAGFVAAALTGLRIGEIHHHARTHHARRHIDRPTVDGA